MDYQPYETGIIAPPTTPEEVDARVEDRILEDERDEDASCTNIILSTTDIHSHISSSISLSHSSNEHNYEGHDMNEASGNEDSDRFDLSLAPPNSVAQWNASMPNEPPVTVMMMPLPPPLMMMPMQLLPMMPPPLQVGYLTFVPTGAPIACTLPSMHQGTIPNINSQFEIHVIPENSKSVSMHENPITILVQVQNITPIGQWKLYGQVIEICLNPTDIIATLKAKIQNEIGMPPAKQKISYRGIFLKDRYTADHYNLVNGTLLHLGVKRRGGRRK